MLRYHIFYDMECISATSQLNPLNIHDFCLPNEFYENFELFFHNVRIFGDVPNALLPKYEAHDIQL